MKIIALLFLISLNLLISASEDYHTTPEEIDKEVGINNGCFSIYLLIYKNSSKKNYLWSDNKIGKLDVSIPVIDIKMK